MRRVTLRFVLALLAVCSWAAPSLALSQREARTYYDEGLRELKNQRFDEAMKDFSRAAENREFLPARYGLARVHQAVFERDMKHFSEADKAYSELLAELERLPPGKIGHEMATAYLDAGFLYLKGADYPRAQRLLERFLALSPDSLRLSEAHNALGIACYYLDRYDQAVNCFKRALEANIANNEARFNLRSVYTRVEAFSEALSLYRGGKLGQALLRIEGLRDLAPRYVPGRRLEANLLQEMDRHEEAVRVFNEILGFDPDSLESYRLRIEMARSLITLQRPTEARLALVENLAKFPDVADGAARIEVLMLLNQLGRQ